MRDAYPTVGDWRNAAEAQAILAEDNPSFNEYANLAYFWFNALDLKRGDAALEEARKHIEEPSDRQALKQFAELRKEAKKVKKEQGKVPSDGADPLADPSAGLSGQNPLSMP